MEYTDLFNSPFEPDATKALIYYDMAALGNSKMCEMQIKKSNNSLYFNNIYQFIVKIEEILDSQKDKKN
jgi:hypothetical protein